MSKKYVYMFSEGNAGMRNLLGGKGAGHHADAEHDCQQQGRHALQAMPGCLAFQVVFPPFLCGNCWFRSIYLRLLGHRPLSRNCCTKVR